MAEKQPSSSDWRSEEFYIQRLGSQSLVARWSKKDENEDDDIYELADAARVVARGMTRYAIQPGRESTDALGRTKIVDRSGTLLTFSILGFDQQRFEGSTSTWESDQNPDRMIACAELAVKLLEGLVSGEYTVSS